tara:strand:+ start:763 stop:1998 length:1236 start_codon:yes stop_codon:yes gene_type:complete
MKTIMFSPRNTGFIFNRFHTFTEHLLNHFKLFTQLKDLSHHFKPANLIYFDQNSYSKNELFKLYKSEHIDFISTIDTYITHHLDNHQKNLPDGLLDSSFLEMIARFHLVKEMLATRQVDYLFICTTEIYLIDLAREMNVKTIFLEHAPNFFPFTVFDDTKRHHLPFTAKFPDMILSENQLSTRHWHYQCNRLNQTHTKILETGLPLDNMVKLQHPFDSDRQSFTISIFNTWLDKSRPENLIENELNLILLFENLFRCLSDLLPIKPFRVLLKNHPKLDENAYQTHRFYHQLAKKYGIDDFEICNDLDATIHQTDLAITLGKSSLLTDLLYSKKPSIIYSLLSDSVISYFDDINNIFPIVSSANELHALIKKYLVSNEYDTHQKKLSDIQNQFQLNKRTLEEKCHQIIKYLT